MCNPVLIAGAVMMAASVAENSTAASKVKSARLEAVNANRAKQSALDTQATAANNDARQQYDKFTGPDGQQATTAKTLADFYNGQGVDAPPPSAAVPASSSNMVVDEEKKQNAKADAFSQKTGTALADLRSFGEALGGDSRAEARDAGTVGQINNFKTGDAASLPFALDAANNSANGTKSTADILQGLGSIAMMYGAGAGAGAGGAAGNGAASNAALIGADSSGGTVAWNGARTGMQFGPYNPGGSSLGTLYGRF